MLDRPPVRPAPSRATARASARSTAIITFDNPAACVAHVLEEVKASGDDQQAVATWMKILDVPDQYKLALGFAQLTDQFVQAKAAVLALPEDEDPEFLAKNFPAVETLLNEMLLAMNIGQMQHYKGRVSDEMIYSMHACAKALRRHGVRTPTLDEAGVHELLELVRQLIDKAEESEFPDKLKMYMVRKLREVEDLLHGVKIVGYDAVVTALDEMLGGAFRAAAGDKSAFAKAGDWIARVWGTLATVATGTTAITKATEETIRLLAS